MYEVKSHYARDNDRFGYPEKPRLTGAFHFLAFMP